MIQYPISTIVRKPVPKNAFYKHLELNTRLRTRFVEDVEKIVWAAKYTPSTLNVEDGATVHEIVFFEVTVKAEDLTDEIFLTIDKMMPRHVVFVLVYEDRCRLLLNYKEWADKEKGTFNVVKTFCTSWQPSDSINLTIEGSTMDKIYESFAGQVSGFGTNNATDTRRIIAIENEIATKQKLAEALQKKIRKEKQFARQVEMNTEARALKREIGRLKEELKKIKYEI